ncbi:MAG: GntR family transcriptional regulator [Spirochaetales bacterium]|jgi:DNA-binding GntR family transcriptional regulator|nr:GntR family transcriptional regulator [Spirochaetales bacterium]
MQADGRGAAATQPLQEKVYTLIKDEIVNCGMSPGSVICEDVLVEKFGTSRTPIREALLRLQRERLVDIFPRQGTFVSQISLKDIYEIYQLRLIIEPQVIKISCRNLDPAVLSEFRDFFTRLETQECPYAEWFRQDRELHSYIVDSSGNRQLQQMYATIMDQNLRMRILAGKIPSRMRDTNHEHLAILDALLAKDEEKAEQVMASHILSSRAGVLRLEGFREGSPSPDDSKSLLYEK